MNRQHPALSKKARTWKKKPPEFLLLAQGFGLRLLANPLLKTTMGCLELSSMLSWLFVFRLGVCDFTWVLQLGFEVS